MSSAPCVLVCCCIAGPVHSPPWPALLRRRLCPVTQVLSGPLHRVGRAAPSVLSVWCRAACCCALHCTCGQKAVGCGTLASTATLLGGCGQWNSCNAMPHCLGEVRSGSLAVHRLTALEHWAVELLLNSSSLPGGTGQWRSCFASPDRLEALCTGRPAMHCLIA